jgi:hypothetical protein
VLGGLVPVSGTSATMATNRQSGYAAARSAAKALLTFGTAF